MINRYLSRYYGIVTLVSIFQVLSCTAFIGNMLVQKNPIMPGMCARWFCVQLVSLSLLGALGRTSKAEASIERLYTRGFRQISGQGL